jgi:hypothetical protein
MLDVYYSERWYNVEDVSSRKMLCLLKTSRDLQMLFAAVTHLVEGLSFETPLKLK